MQRLMPAGWAAGPAGLCWGKARPPSTGRPRGGAAAPMASGVLQTRGGLVPGRGRPGGSAAPQLVVRCARYTQRGFPCFLLQNGSESHISKSSRCVFPKIFD